jgi:F-box interacting protein
VPNTGAPPLPPDALFEVLLRLPAKDLCRLRAVCRSWRALTYDPHFAAVHKSRQAEPLFAFTFRDVAVVGLSGQVLRRIPFGSDGILLTHLDRLCVIRMCRPSLAASVLSPATAAALALPGPHSDEFVGTCTDQRFDWGSFLTHNCQAVTYAFGQVASTGDYKVLRIGHPDRLQPELCDIITLDGSSQGRWRRKQNPPSDLMRNQIMECLAVNGVVHFFFDHGLKEPTSIAPFDLDTEKWMPTLRGPEPLRSAKFGLISGRLLSLANLNGSLVIVDNDVCVSFDLWFLVDHKRGLWVKKYRLSIKQLCYFVRPLLILDDGRIVIFQMVERLLQCYDPTTGNLVDVLDIGAIGLAESQSIGVYTGSLLI